MKIGSLFSGYGGLDLAVMSVLGGELAWVADVEPGPRVILKSHWPGVPNLGDVTAVDWSRVEPVDVITGGSPCQDLSLAGARRGMTTGTRSNLWVAMREAIAVLRPRMVVWENVRGALSAVAESEADHEDDLGLGAGLLGDGAGGPALRALGRVLGDLADLGFDAEWRGIRAADVGAPHGRFRVFVVARAADTNRGGLEGHAQLDGDQASGPADWRARRTDAHGCPPAHASGVADERRRVGGELRCSQETTQGEGHQRERGWRASGDRGETTLMPTPDASLGSRGGAQDPEKRRAGGHSVSISDAVSVLGDRFGPYAPAVHRWEQVLGRPAPAPTDHGRLSARFVEWMMGLPDGFVTGVPISRSVQLRALGNGVVPQQAAAALGVAA
jgi:DNA (cytosine-5)-methyltransferase 1